MKNVSRFIKKYIPQNHSDSFIFQAPPAEETIKSNELHYATIDFGYTESKKITKTTESTEYATIRTDSKDDTDDYDVVIVR